MIFFIIGLFTCLILYVVFDCDGRIRRAEKRFNAEIEKREIKLAELQRRLLKIKHQAEAE